MLFVVLFPVLQVFGIPNSPRSLDLDDRQGFIASSAMQQKKKEGIPVSLCYCIGKLYKKMHYMVGYDGCLHEACGCSLDSPPAYNPMHLRPSIVRVCRACFSLPLEAAELHPEFDFDPGENL